MNEYNEFDISAPVSVLPPSEQAEEIAAKDRAAIAMIHLAKGEHRRADSMLNPDDIFICQNGHLQYNVVQEEKDEMLMRGVPLPPLAYEGGLCRFCPNPPLTITKLTSVPKELQQKLGSSMELNAQLRSMIEPLQAANSDNNRIALFLRQRYDWEIASGQSQHDGDLSRAVIHYLKIERGRWAVRRGQWLRAIKRMMGVG